MEAHTAMTRQVDIVPQVDSIKVTLPCSGMFAPTEVAARVSARSITEIPGGSTMAPAAQALANVSPSGTSGGPLPGPVTQVVAQAPTPYAPVVSCQQSSYLPIQTARIQLPSNLCFKEWEMIVITSEDNLIVHFLKFDLPADYTGPVSILSEGNHPSTNHYPQDLAVYSVKELKQGAMLGLFSPRHSSRGAGEPPSNQT